MPKIILYIACSLDGFIASKDGSVEWLRPFESYDYGYDKFFAGIGTVIMGSRTYEQILTFGKWPYGSTKTYVVTSRALEGPQGANVEFWSGDLEELTKVAKREAKEKDVWLVGGSRLAAKYWQKNMIDELHLFLIPVLLGGGISLMADVDHRVSLQLRHSTMHRNDVIELHYVPIF
jgi:dihydrofolate reductase